MVETGEVFARISEGPLGGGGGMVEFLEDPERYDSGGTAARVDGLIQGAIALAARLQAADHQVRGKFLAFYLLSFQFAAGGPWRACGGAVPATAAAPVDWRR